jgi:hypothetical protein
MYKVILKAIRKTKDSPFWFFSPAGQAHSSIVEATVQQNQHLIEDTRRGYIDETELQYNVVYVSANKSNWDLFQSSLVAEAPNILEERDQYFIDNKHALVVVIVPEEGQDPIFVTRVPAAE